MATRRVTAHTTAVKTVATPKHWKTKISAVNIDNTSDERITLYLQDIFTPDASNGEDSPSEQTVVRWEGTVPAHNSASLQADALGDVYCIGDVYVDASAISALCSVIVNYHFV